MLLKSISIALAAAALSGCAAMTQSFEQPPSLAEVNVRVSWSSNDQIYRKCGPNKYACATVGRPTIPFSQIWTEKPANVRDTRRVCSLGHEFLHSLGADHAH